MGALGGPQVEKPRVSPLSRVKVSFGCCEGITDGVAVAVRLGIMLEADLAVFRKAMSALRRKQCNIAGQVVLGESQWPTSLALAGLPDLDC